MTKPGTAPSKRRRRLSPQGRRALIDQAATAVFARRGYQAATLQEIAFSAGIVASVIYDHYRSKEDLYLSLLNEHSRALRERTIHLPSASAPRAGLRLQIDAFYRGIESDSFLWRTMFFDPPSDPEIATTHAQLQAKAGQAITKVLQAGAKRRGAEVRPADVVAARMLAELVKGALNNLASWWWEHREVERDAVVEAATSLLWDGISKRVDAEL
jgi:AcrR family transcriptional regulator